MWKPRITDPYSELDDKGEELIEKTTKMGNSITMITKETITMVMQIIIITIATTTNQIITMNNKETIIIMDLTTKTIIKGPINKD